MRTVSVFLCVLAGFALSACDAAAPDEVDVEISGGEEAFPGRRGPVARATIGTATGVREVDYEVIDGWAVAEGDIILGRAEDLTRSARSATRSDTSYRWPGGYIPYVVTSSLSAQTKADIQAAVDHWNASTVFYLYPRTTETDYVQFVSGSGCSSPVGRQGGRQDISLGPGCGVGQAIHEIGHAAGLWHEQTRSDRDTFLTVHWDNITDGKEGNFRTYAEQGEDGRSPYGFDFGSVMLYGSYFFSTNGSPTLTRKDGSVYTAQRNGLSAKDIAGVTMFQVYTPGQTLYRLKIGASECLDTVNGGSTPGTQLVLRPCSTSTSQLFYWFTLPSVSERRLVHRASGMCVDIPSSSTASGVVAQLFPCHGYDNQAFTFQRTSATASTYMITFRHSGKCLARSNLSTAAGASAMQATCDALNGFQQFSLAAQ